MSLNEGRVRPSSSARVQSLCAYTDMHRGHRWGCHRHFKMDGLFEKTLRLFAYTGNNTQTQNRCLAPAIKLLNETFVVLF